MLNPKRLFGYLATGTMPEATALDESLASYLDEEVFETNVQDARIPKDGYEAHRKRCRAKKRCPYDDFDVIPEADNAERKRFSPNGRKSNLSARQRKMVRTKEFKDWFGDWESNVVSAVSEIESKQIVKNWRDERTEFKNEDTERKAELKADWTKLFSAKAKGQSDSYAAHYAAVAAIDRLFPKSVIMWREAPRNGSEDVESYAKYGKVFWFDGIIYLAKMTVKEYSPRVGIKDGFYSLEAMEVEKINVAGNNGDISVRGQILDRDVGKRISKQIADVNATSKMVDENGEPAVFYHGTRGDEFDEFKPGYRTGGKCVFFADKKRKDELAGYYAQDDGRILECFLNIRNLHEATPETKEALTKRDCDGFVTRYDEDEERRFFNFSKNKAETIRHRVGDIIEVGVFDPKNIKSATDNSGAFSTQSKKFKE